MPPYHCRRQLLRELDVELHPHQRRESEEKHTGSAPRSRPKAAYEVIVIGKVRGAFKSATGAK